jgi:hypothetical protein
VLGARHSPVSRFPLSCLLVSAIAWLTACSTTAEITPDGTLVRHYFGHVKVVVPRAVADQPVYTSSTSVLGFYAGDGFGVGYVRDHRVVVPLDCRLVVLVANRQQLDEAMRRLDTIGKAAGLCAAVDQGIVNTEKEEVQ